ncbi:hypothetical protein CHS0354_005979 [Potamilus streckersoni]|uniref:VWFA domain-containing protein n=1 Tax=Potamilus streckersoni TaxID=2493646 RepID=A0AAE0VGP9_9BIVA|nr:hypothetical protein CHS0354_005979 [Potamilus streckersoni]
MLSDYILIRNKNNFFLIRRILKCFITGTCTLDPVDVVFVLDSTGSIGSAGFQNELDFVQEFTNLVKIGRDAFHIGVVQFGHNTLKATTEFDLNRYSDKSSIISAVQRIIFQSGGIDYIDACLQLAKYVLDQTSRSNSVKYVVLLTDGGSRDESATLVIAGILKASYTSLRLYVIGIGISAPTLHLQQVASDPSFFLHVNQPANLVSFVNSAVSTTCKD